MSNCSSCGKGAPEGSRFCPFCGGKIVVARPKAVDPLIGKIVGDKYIVKELIGSGAMGSIYKAEHKDLSRPVALKVLHRHLLTDEGQVHRFHREAKAASRLHHPNCIMILDFGKTEDGWFYIAMEYLPGRDLSRIIAKDGKMAVKKAIHIATQVLNGLDEAHAAGVVHRDLKPENVMVEALRSDPDFVKVLDFGIAKIRDSAGSEESSGFKTATGMVFGTPEYMSPEQIRGDELDGRSDLYSLGVVMYQMLAGVMPFTGETVIEIATAHLVKPVPNMRPLRPDVPEKLVCLIEKLMIKKREQRFQTAADVREALSAVGGIPSYVVHTPSTGDDPCATSPGRPQNMNGDTIVTAVMSPIDGMVQMSYPVALGALIGIFAAGGILVWAISVLSG